MLPALVQSSGGRRYGYHAGPRSYPLAKLTIPLAPVFPSGLEVDLSTWLGPVKDQGSLGACTAFAGAGDLEYLHRKFRHMTPVFAPLFLYYKEREHDNSLADGDTGSYGNTSCWVINHVGCCTEETCPYEPDKFQTPPNEDQLRQAAYYKSGAYHAVMTVGDLRSCLNSHYCVRVGFTVYDSFESDRVAETGMMPVPDKSREMILGGHEVLFYGCSDSQQCFLVRNSWGSGWGLGGNFKFPYAAAADPDVFIDGRIQHFGPPWVPKK